MATATNEISKNSATSIVANSAPKELRITNQVLDEVNKMSRGGKLTLPDNYSAENALASAWIMLQDIQGKDKRYIIENGKPTGIVTNRSIANSLLDMVTQGLNPAKKQCYFIVYGDRLICQRGYFGDMALAERVVPGITFYYDTINKGDEFSVSKVRTKKGFVTAVKSHDIPFPRGVEIIGAYCGAISPDGEDLGCDVFDMARIRQSWAKSKTAGYENSTHSQFTAEMCLRTVIRHRCKPIVNSSSDELLKKAIQDADINSVEAEVNEQASTYANSEIIDVQYEREPLPTEVEAETQKHSQPQQQSKNGKPVDLSLETEF